MNVIHDEYNHKNRENDPMLLIEDVLDTLVEVGNGVTDEHLHEAADKLFKARHLLEHMAMYPLYRIPFRAESREIETTSVLYLPFCEECGHRLMSMKVDVPLQNENIPSKHNPGYRINFTPTTCPICGRLFTSAQIPTNYTTKHIGG